MGATIMDQRLWNGIEAIFHAALERSPQERAAFLADACGGDEKIRREVEQLLEQDTRDSVAIDTPAGERATFLYSTELQTGLRLGPYRITGTLGQAAWDRCTAPRIHGSAGRSQSSCSAPAWRYRQRCGNVSIARRR